MGIEIFCVFFVGVFIWKCLLFFFGFVCIDCYGCCVVFIISGIGMFLCMVVFVISILFFKSNIGV